MCDEDSMVEVGAVVAAGASLPILSAVAGMGIGVVAVAGVIASAVTALVSTLHTALFVAEVFGVLVFAAYAMKTLAKHRVVKSEVKRSEAVATQGQLGAGVAPLPELEAGEPVIDLAAVREARAA